MQDPKHKHYVNSHLKGQLLDITIDCSSHYILKKKFLLK